MGNCCSSQSKDENFRGEGRTLAPAPANAPPQSHAARASAPPRVGGAGRTLGSTSNNDAGGARAAAARAAEERARASQASGGRLGQDLKQQQRQTQNQALAQGARNNLAAREADAAAQARYYE